MSRENTLSRRRLRTWIRLLRISRSTENHLREFLRTNYDTTLPRFDVGAALYRAGEPMKMSDLSKELLVSNGNATTVVGRLEKDGFVSRTPQTGDKRVVLVELTALGKSWFKKLALAHEREVDRLFAALDHADLSLVRHMTHRLEGEEDE